MIPYIAEMVVPLRVVLQSSPFLWQEVAIILRLYLYALTVQFLSPQARNMEQETE